MNLLTNKPTWTICAGPTSTRDMSNDLFGSDPAYAVLF